MNTIESIASELHGRRNGSGWMVLCPAHADRNPSLAINEGEGGKVLVKCFAGCSQDAVIASLKSLDLWPNADGASERNGAHKPNLKAASICSDGPKIDRPPAGVAPPDFGSASYSWCYRDAAGDPLFYVARYESGAGKQIVPYSWDTAAGGKWVNRGWPAPRPLYGLDLLANKPETPVLITEGEKAADAARLIVQDRYVVVTWPNGAKAVDKTDWSPLHGRKVLIWPDADGPGLEAANQITRILAPYCHTGLIEIDPEHPDTFTAKSGFDAADALSLGWDWEAFKEWSSSKVRRVEVIQDDRSSESLPSNGFASVSQSTDEAKRARERGRTQKCSTGIRFLDKVWSGGLGIGDLGAIAAPPGAGKTEMAIQIATHNAAAGKNVYLFALEADPFEVTQRLQFKELASLYYSPSVFTASPKFGRPLNYSDWLDGRFESALQDLERQAEENVREKYKTLFVYYRDRDFGVEDLTQRIMAVKDHADLIIVDHIHYIDLEGENENRAMSDLIKAIRDVALISLKPILIIAHVRKKDGRSKVLLPDLDDIHGTSNLGKVCTKVAMLAPCYSETREPNEFYTYLRAVKNRRDGSRIRFPAVVTFDISKNRYHDAFRIGRFIKDGQEFEALKPDEMPFWVRD